MAKLLPIKYREMMSKLKALGYSGPYPGSKHPYMEHRETGTVFTVFNDHGSDIGPELQKQIIRRLGLTNDEWINS